MAIKVAGELYESITGQLFEIGRQLRQPSGYPFDPEQLKALLQGAIEGHLSLVAKVKKRLQLVTASAVAAIERFKYADNFKVDSGKISVRIWYLGDDFQEHFGRKEERASEAVEIKVHKLLESSLDIQIITELADKCEIMLGHFFALLKKQGKGQRGSLLTNGWANIAFIRDNKNVLRTVRAEWSTSRGGWGVEAYSLDSLYRWNNRDQVLSR